MKIPFAPTTRLSLLVAGVLAVVLVTTTLARGPAEALDGPVDVVYVADGRNFPDSLAGATLAATAGAPLLMVKSELPVPSETTAALAVLDPDRIVILGGPLAVSDEVAEALEPYATTGTVTRLFGATRYGTAAAIADALPDKVHDADLLDGQDSGRYTTHWLHSVNGAVRSHSPGLGGVRIERPAAQPVGVYCIFLPDGVQQAEAAVGSVQLTSATVRSYGITVTTTRGHNCNSTGSWDLAVDITADGVLEDSDFSVMFSGSESVYP
ncbi:cell wall-binding repeat-containing protein [Ornithinimicrobium faecis]|uniref:cell wall-binding repeat-containing protein n=1 Tax=Ornithinimicrobium faecis TaxID=2934158 RepID=UPI002118E597|nr:cell wall-binding repeat-containing protein [Ornithinimicrobium sp. HY1745]